MSDLSKYVKVRAMGLDPTIHLSESTATLCGIETTYSNNVMQAAPDHVICSKCKAKAAKPKATTGTIKWS